jgi:hypothetical protein
LSAINDSAAGAGRCQRWLMIVSNTGREFVSLRRSLRLAWLQIAGQIGRRPNKSPNAVRRTGAE